ncbi:type II toxin-antitoxin system RelE/ParE family toxin [Mesorhizobium sp. M1066]|uniref:type II toxin-antitoxin system RelE/ParE family toxin n=1 Tax=unclassified Mesorhizobium TaxID=325217 RepID=UPI00333B8621
MQVSWTGAALDDLDQIQDFVAQDSPVAAYRLTADIIGRTDELLASNPMIGRQGRAGGTRELVIARTPYIVVYRVRGSDVEIIAIVHGAREWPEGHT